jgi:isoprenylcysteine carboxyl methyltransferase (ICMT) family protein YpbQ
MPNLRKPWMLSGLANRLFCVSSWVTVVSLVLVVAASSLRLDHTIDLGDSWRIKIGFFMCTHAGFVSATSISRHHSSEELDLSV